MSSSGKCECGEPLIYGDSHCTRCGKEVAYKFTPATASAPTDVAAYREVTFADAERIKESADGVPSLQSETNDMLAALIEHHAVIRCPAK